MTGCNSIAIQAGLSATYLPVSAGVTMSNYFQFFEISTNQAKNLFLHPIQTVSDMITSFVSQKQNECINGYDNTTKIQNKNIFSVEGIINAPQECAKNIEKVAKKYGELFNVLFQ